ncbi:MAG: hypothetical protein UR23_C0001G0014 [Candidatus Roizmanbacteria bacterium GW2011_GWA2_32_13]|uniref:DUF1611 domain-containing protein n=1 Tax=Candidatus Roizmanbacteria bacterium GW2011_GWA2_32_13 TaxID=1618475 RepID=A0A0F9ZFI4_9BACT|nr:MAG: hypothetical protein UR23_C0001G0014 [Candidatus Roizmanbacteria bacterium GW2011_GWA2_32_13]
MKTQNIVINKIGSVLKNENFNQGVYFSKQIHAVEGQAVVVKVLDEQTKYGKLELTNGSMSKIKKGELIVGVLGERKALAGIVGIVPKDIKTNDVLNILNIGGVIGKAISWNKDFVDSPISVKILGEVNINNKSLNIHDSIQKLDSVLIKTASLIVVMGTAMNVGKTTATVKLIQLIKSKTKLNLVAAKLSGIAAQKDILAMKKAGASQVLSFLDVGISSTINNHEIVVPAAKTIINKLAKEKPDLIVVELGDGIIGWYGVEKLLNDKEFSKAMSLNIMCAHDLVGAKGSYDMLKSLNLKIDFFTGPVSNNTAGTDYLENNLKIPAQDLRYDTKKLLQVLKKKGVIKYD